MPAALPNLITLSRIALVFPVIWLISLGDTPSLWMALGIMAVCEFSDWLDGHLARSTQNVSKAGKILDPMADSLYRVGVFVALVANGWMALWMLIVIVVRDLGISELRLTAQRAGLTVAARVSGKFKAFSQGTAQFVAVLLYAAGGGAIDDASQMVISGLLWVATLVTLWSLIDYTVGVVGALRLQAAEHA